MKKKIMAVTLCLAMVSTFAVGCGQKNETDSGKSALISMLPILLVYIFAQKYFVQGIVMSGIKG